MCSDLIGKPFRDGAHGPDAFDCWGIVHHIYAQHGVQIPHYAITAYDAASVFRQFEQALPEWREVPLESISHPDVLAFRFSPNNPTMVTHVGVYLEDGKFLHCLQKTGVIVSRIAEPYYRQRFAGAYEWAGGA